MVFVWLEHVLCAIRYLTFGRQQSLAKPLEQEVIAAGLFHVLAGSDYRFDIFRFADSHLRPQSGPDAVDLWVLACTFVYHIEQF